MSEQKKVMSTEELYSFIRNMSCSKLFQELADMVISKRSNPGQLKIPSFFTGVYQTLYALGYDRNWIDTTLKDELERFYVTKAFVIGQDKSIDEKILPFLLGAKIQ